MNMISRKKQAYLVLFVFLPAYIMFAVTIIALIDRLNIWVELLVYLLLGIVWVFPFKLTFRGLASKNEKK